MALYKLGSRGEEVKRLQEKLKELGYYRGPIDGDFGGGTESAVKAFQKRKKLDIDGIVGPVTWKMLFDEKIGQSVISASPPDYKVLALTGSFETGTCLPECFAGLSGDFDGQGMSFGVLQWNFGQDSLQPLLSQVIAKHGAVAKSIFQANYDVLVKVLNAGKDEQMTFVRSIQHPVKHYLYEPWRGMFKALGRTEEFQAIELQHAKKAYQAALRLCSEYGLWSERAVALMFDIKVQNGSINEVVKAQILADFHNQPDDLSEDEWEVRKMQVVANRRAEAAKPQWIEDVRARKLCCANGGGTVHGNPYDIEEQFGIGLKRI
jgi:hypothetical protein